MKCIHHIDADGLCAAAIVRREFAEVFMPPTKEDFIAYNHGWEITLPDADKCHMGEEVYIVDLALDETIMGMIRYFINCGCHVIHIDHHISGKRYYESMSDADKQIYDQVTHLFNTDYSGTMLTWVYACMNPDERHDPTKVQFDFTDKFDHVGFWFNTPNFREYAIPLTVRYVDDNDVWRHALEESKYFALAFNMEEDTSPLNDKLWNDLLYSSTQIRTVEFVRTGELLYRYQESVDKSVINNAFEAEINGIKTLCLNTPHGNSRIFGEKYNEYPMVCKFAYDGKLGKWRYTFYSDKKFASFVDCGAIATTCFNGGGHRGAAGGMLDYNYFDIIKAAVK